MKILIPILLTALLLSSACGQSGTEKSPEGKTGNAGQEQNGSTEAAKAKPERNSKVVARVNGVPIYEDELNGRPVDSLITDEILYQKGLNEGLDKKYEDRIREYRMSLVVMEVKNKFTESQPPEEKITDEDLLEYYNSAKDTAYTSIRAEEINFKDEGLGGQIIKMAKEGKNLQDIAKDLSDAESEMKVSDPGYDKKYNAYFDVKEVGSVSSVIRKPDGTYSVLKILEVKVIPYDKIKSKIGHTIEARRKGAAFNKYAREVAQQDGFTVEIIDSTSHNN
ncbi:MAG: hypothetical protein AB1598_13770 [Thermodesulfobacteriota bacterium]